MDYVEYVNGISFRLYKPKVRAYGYMIISKFLNIYKFPPEIANTKLPINEKETKQELGVLIDVPRMSTFAVGAMINRAVSDMSIATCFVNVGVWNGFTFLNGILGNSDKRCIGTDNLSEFLGPRDEFIERFDFYKSKNHQYL